EVIELYRALIAEASALRGSKAPMANAQQAAKSDERDLLPGAVTRLNAFVPERIAQIEQLSQELLAKAEARHKAQVEELSAHLERTNELLERTNELLRDKSLSLAESETREDELRKRLGLQLKATERLCRFLDETNYAAAQLRSSARWQVANPVAALKAKLSPSRSDSLLGYGHLEKVVSAYLKWRTA